MAIVYKNSEYRNLQEQVLKNAQDIQILKEKPGLKVVVVNELPAVGEENILYLVPKNPDPDTSDADSYDEYIWIPETQTFEFVGSTALSLDEVEKLGFKNPNNERQWRIRADESGNLVIQTSTDNINWTNAAFWNSNRDFNLLSNQLITSNAQINGETTMKADSSSATNVWKLRPVNDYNLYISRDGSDKFLFQANMFAPATYQTTSINLGSFNYKWDKVFANQLNLGDSTTNLYIAKDASDRIGIYHNNIERVKIGNDGSSYFAISVDPDQDNLFDLGKDALRWKNVNATRVQNKNSVLYLQGKGGINFNGNLIPNNIAQEIGTAAKPVSKIYASKIGSNSNTLINVADIVTKPNYANPNVFASGTLDANGESTIDISAQGVGMPADGVYMFTYGNTQCFIALTSTMLQNATQYPIRCPCPLLVNGSGYPGNLRIDRSADILTLKVAAPNVGTVQPSGYEWKLIKVM